MKKYNFIKYVLQFLNIFVFFYCFWLLFGQFWRFSKVLENQKIQGGGSKIAAVLIVYFHIIQNVNYKFGHYL